MSERSGWDMLQIFLLTGVLMAFAYSANGSTRDLERTASSSFRHSSPVIYVEDSTGARWPVGSTAAMWSRGTDVSLRYARCRTDAPCIRVTESRWPIRGGGTASYATTTRNKAAGRTRATIKLNNNPGLSRRERRAVVCRELGRALGLSYNSGASSCVSRSAQAPARPTDADVRSVNRLY